MSPKADSHFLPNWIISRRRYILALVDAFLVALALALAYFVVAMDVSGFSLDYLVQFRALLPVVVVVQIVLFAVLHLYRGLLRYAGGAELKVIVLATSIVTLALIALNISAPFIERLWWAWPTWSGEDGTQQIRRIPWTVTIIYWMLAIMLVGGFRFSRRLLVSTFRRRDGKNVIIVGLAAGESAARHMLQRPEEGYDPVGFVDPDPLKVGRRVHGLVVLGTLVDLSRLIREYAVELVVIALPEAGGRQISEIMSICRAEDAEAKILPTVSKIMAGQIEVSAIRPVTIEDILGRDPVELELAPELNYVRDKRVLVTGAGGSIGSEIVAQILRLEPKQIVLLGRGENSLFEIAGRINIGFQDKRFPLVVADARDRARMRHVFERFHPEVVFHAAAHKHVPFMEINPGEAIKNNVLATRDLATLAAEFHVERFILISTDKAVRPTSVMGASKRLAEMVMWDVAAGHRETRFITVRFGNVLGSRGSVVPTLKRQIASGGPVTITHRDMTRYFMTIPEAASLVIQAGALGGATDEGDGETEGAFSARLYLLDMGEPVKIIDLVHNLITLSGLKPGHDIEVKEIGPRPGEKIHEELLTDSESVSATRFGKIFSARPDTIDRETLSVRLTEMEAAAEAGDEAAIRAILSEVVPGYHPPEIDSENI